MSSAEHSETVNFAGLAMRLTWFHAIPAARQSLALSEAASLRKIDSANHAELRLLCTFDSEASVAVFAARGQAMPFAVIACAQYAYLSKFRVHFAVQICRSSDSMENSVKSALSVVAYQSQLQKSGALEE